MNAKKNLKNLAYKKCLRQWISTLVNGTKKSNEINSHVFILNGYFEICFFIITDCHKIQVINIKYHNFLWYYEQNY